MTESEHHLTEHPFEHTRRRSGGHREGRAVTRLALVASTACSLLILSGAAGVASGVGSGAAGGGAESGRAMVPASGFKIAEVGDYQQVGSANWSGYAQHTKKKATFTAVKDTWTVPTIKSGKSGTEYASDWVGVGGYSEGTLVQAGTTEINSNGTAHYSAWTEILPAASVTISGLVIHAGDEITTVVEETSANVWSMTVSDITSGKSGGKTVNYKSSGESAEAIHERPEVGGGLATLAATTNVTFDPGDYSTAAPGHQTWKALLKATSVAKLAEIFMTNNAGTKTIASPSAPSTNGLGFSVADGSTSPPPPA
jgi:Peptidase A4 family